MMLVLGLAVGAHCLTPVDQTAGWKQTTIPPDLPALAAPGDVDQFRAGEPALVLSEPRFEYRSDPHTGRLGLSFDVARGAQHLRVRFAHRLDGMKVDAWTQDSAGRVTPLLDGRRIAGDELQLDWRADTVEVVGVKLHHHLRERPIVEEWRSGQWELVSSQPSGVLSWRHPGGRKIELCDAPKQRLEVRGATP